MSSAIVSLQNIASWVFITLALWPIGITAMRLVWRSDEPCDKQVIWAAGLVVSPFIFALIAWLANWYFKVPLDSHNLRLLALILILLAVFVLRETLPRVLNFNLQDFASSPGFKAARNTVLAYLLVFSAWTLFRSFNPEIFWGEKPMDFSFLNYLIRFEQLVPDDPWAAGHALNYYYFGQFTWAMFHKLAGVDSAYGYNLALSSIASGLFLATWVWLKTLGIKPKLAILGAFVVTCGANLEWLTFLINGTRSLGFDHFWATSRLLTSPAITEYPSWSVMFADLHAHLIALPLSVICYAIMFRMFCSQTVSHGAWALLGALEAVLYATNSWEIIPHFGVLLLGAAVTVMRAEAPFKQIIPLVGKFLVLVLGALVFLIPWLIGLGEGVTIHYGWVVQDYSTAWQLARHFGQFLVPLLIACFFGLITFPGKSLWVWILSICAALTPLLAALFVAQFSLATPPFLLIGVCSLVIFIGVSKIMLGVDSELGVLLTASGMLISLCELIFVMDHTNTIFKLYLSIWIWLGVVAIMSVAHLQKRLRTFGLSTVAYCALGLGGCGAIINGYSLLTFQRVAGPRPTLNGMLYLPSLSRPEAELIFWMRHNLVGAPVVVEAIGDSYREFGRITMNTGLPAVLGWDYHISQRGVELEDRLARADAVNTVYGSESIEQTVKALKQYKVSYVVLGQVEKRLVTEGKYSQRAFDKFKSHPELFERVFNSDGVELFAVRQL